MPQPSTTPRLSLPGSRPRPQTASHGACRDSRLPQRRAYRHGSSAARPSGPRGVHRPAPASRRRWSMDSSRGGRSTAPEDPLTDGSQPRQSVISASTMRRCLPPEAGCQAEIGVASAFAALTATAYDAPSLVVENAAESALEHHLGMTSIRSPATCRCRASSAARSARQGLDRLRDRQQRDRVRHRVDFDATVMALAQTAKEMNSKYKETSEAGSPFPSCSAESCDVARSVDEGFLAAVARSSPHIASTWLRESFNARTSRLLHLSSRAALTSVQVLHDLAFGQCFSHRPAAARFSRPPRQQAPAAAPQTSNDRYRDGIVIWETPARR